MTVRNVLAFPKTRAQAARLDRWAARRNRRYPVSFKILPHDNRRRLLRTWRISQGIIQDVAYIAAAGGYRKVEGVPFEFSVQAERVSWLVDEVLQLVADERLEVVVNEERLRRTLLRVLPGRVG